VSAPQVFAEHSALAEGGDSAGAWQRLSAAVDEAAPAEVAPWLAPPHDAPCWSCPGC